jgi:tetratricopeptide (TPR) repeat protein
MVTRDLSPALLCAGLTLLGATAALAQPREADTHGSDRGDRSAARGSRQKPDSDAAPTAEQPTQQAQQDAVDKEQKSRRHFLSGVKLYRDENWAGALAEFEAAYALKPGAGAMQNIALCLKALFRYAEAAERLEQLLSRHADELDEAERQSVQEAMDELGALVGTLVLEVKPPEARVRVDGRATSQPERSAGVGLNVGEHSIDAEAPGYARLTRVVRVAGGQRLTERLQLKPTAGFVSIETGDPDAAIAIDGKPLAFTKWSGPVAPGRRLLQVYKPGYHAYEQRIEVKLGQTRRIRAGVGPPQSEAAPSDARPPELAETQDLALTPREQRGWYGLAALTVFSLGALPEGLQLRAEDERAGGGTGCARAGYRVWTPLGAEVLLEAGRHEVPEACVEDAAAESAECYPYTVDSLRVGGNLRLMSSGEKLRFTSIVGSGAVFRKLELEGSGSAQGVDPYLLLELGAQLNLGHIVLEVDFVASIEGTAGTTGALFGGEEEAGRVYRKSAGGLQLFGFGVRGGWSEWAPRQSARLLQPAALQ